jgi:O-antigen/teichoic acid export membrane protein
LFLLVYHWKIGWFPFFSFRWKQAKKLMRDAWPLIFAGMVVSVYMKIDQVMLKEMLDVKAVGVYAAAVKLCEAWYFLPTALIASLFPAVIEAKIKSKTLYDKRVQNLYDLMVWSSIAVALPTTLLADWVILILYGTDFQEAADVLRIYIWAGVFVTLGIASSKWLIAENLQRYLFLRTILGALLNVGFNLWLIPIYGIKGAAIATLVAQGTASFLSLSFFKKTRHNFLFAAKSLSIYGAYKRTFQKIIIRGR